MGNRETSDRIDLIVIGSGPAGEKGAAQAAYFGKRVALVERPDPRRLRGGQRRDSDEDPEGNGPLRQRLRKRDVYGMHLNLDPEVVVATVVRLRVTE
jgi:NAD(P) transhydrogenase